MRPLFLLFALLTLPLLGEGEYWATQSIHKEIAPRFRLQWETQARLRGGGEGPYLFYSQYLLMHFLKENWAIAGGLRNVWVKREDRWREEQVPLFEFGKLFEGERLHFSFRERVQCNLSRNHFLLRNRLMLRLLLTERVSFYLIDEIFLRNGSRYEENRLEWSLGFRPKKRVRLGGGYMLMSTHHQKDNVLRSFVEFAF